MEYTPLKMQPAFKDYLWGGDRLKTEFGKQSDLPVVAESWELACHADGCSLAAAGKQQGKNLNELAALDKRGFWGLDCRAEDFPVLVKLIDAKQDLSIQVHPSDWTAIGPLGEQGKAEMWYIVDAEAHSFIYYGFSQTVSEAEFRQRAADGTICEVLNKVPVHKGDVFYILPGTIHAIGAGLVIAEIQQSSNTTFRLYDYGRRDKQGNLRPLHLQRAASVLEYAAVVPQDCKANSRASFPDFEMVEMFACEYFRAFRIDVRGLVNLRTDGRSFQHLLCVEGAGAIRQGGVDYEFAKGDSYFIPAAMGEYELAGKGRLLLSRL